MNEIFHTFYNRTRWVAIAIGVLALICFKLLDAHTIDVELNVPDSHYFRSEQERKDEIERGQEALDRVNDGTASEKDHERAAEYLDKHVS